MPHPDPEHVHLWDKWYPQDKQHIRRVCLDPSCDAIEKKKVSA